MKPLGGAAMLAMVMVASVFLACSVAVAFASSSFHFTRQTTLDNDLLTNLSPVIGGVNSDGHFVTLTWKCKDFTGTNSDVYTSNDPGSAEANRLTRTYGELSSIVGVTRAATRRNVMTITVGASRLELLLTDPLGRRTGYDLATGSKVQEIPESRYYTFQLRDDETGELGPAYKIVDLLAAPVGTYTLQIIGMESHTTRAYVTTYDALGSWFKKRVDVTVSPGTILRYKINFQGNGLPTEVKEISVSIPSIRQAVQAAFAAGKIDNQGLMTSLVQKLDAAQAALDRKQPDVVRNILGAFISEVEAQKGKHITKEVAEALIRDAKEFLAQAK